MKTRRGGLIRRGQRGDEETLEMARGSDGTAGPGGSGYVVTTHGPGTVCPPPPPTPLSLWCRPRRCRSCSPMARCVTGVGQTSRHWLGAAPAPVHTPRARAHIPPTLRTHHTPHATLAHRTVSAFSPPFALGDLVGPHPAPADRVTGPL